MSLSDQQWCPSSLQVTVLQARGLRIKGKSGTNDAYAVMQVGKEKFQTSVVEKSVAPVWKEEATFDLPPMLHQGAGGGGGGGGGGTLHVQVLHRALVGPDKMLGQAVINLLHLSEDKTRKKTEWFKLLDKTGKPDKDRGEVLVDIQFLRNNMTASMFDLSAAGKSRSRLGKFKDKVRGKKKESDAASNVVPSFTQVLTDSEEEGRGEEEEVASVGKDEKKKKLRTKSLFSPKSNLKKNMSQSMSVLPVKNSSLSGSQSSGLNAESFEGKKKFKFMIHKRSGSSDSKDPSSAHQKHAPAEQSNLCINGSHIYREEPLPRTSRIGSNYSLASSGHGSMEDVPDSSPPSVDSLRAVRQYSPWTEEEEEEATAEGNTNEEEGELRKKEEETIKEKIRIKREEERLEKLDEEKRRREEEEKRTEYEEIKREEEEERIRREEERFRREEEELLRLAEEKRRREEETKRIDEEKVKEEEERVRREEEVRQRRQQEERIKREEEEERERLAEEMRLYEERRKIEERKKREEEERIRLENEMAEEEERARRREEERKLEMKRLEEEERRFEEEKVRKEEEERIRIEEERVQEERRREKEEMIRQEEEEKRKLEEQEIRQREKEMIDKEEKLRKEKEEYERLVNEKMKLEEEERKRFELQEKMRMEEEERTKLEKEHKKLEEQRKLEQQERNRIEEEEKRQREEEERLRMEEVRRKEEEETARKEKEEYERLVEEKKRLENKRIEEEEKTRKEEQEKERIKEEERARMEKEEMKRLEEEKMRIKAEEKRQDEERIRKKEQAEMEEKEEEARRLEKEILAKDAEEQKANKPKNKAAGKRVEFDIPAEVSSSNPFDETHSCNPFEESPSSPAEPNRGQSSTSTNDKDLVGSHQEKRAAPQPPGGPQSDGQTQKEQDRHLVQINKQSKDKDAKSTSLIPKRSEKKIAPLRSSATRTNNSLSSTQTGATKGTTDKTGKRLAPLRPGSVESELKQAQSCDGNNSQKKTVKSLNPFEDDEDENELPSQNDTTVTGNSGSVQWPPPVAKDADGNATSQMKIKSSKIIRAPQLPATKTSSTLIDQSTGVLVTEDTGSEARDTSDAHNPNSGTKSAVYVKESALQEPQHEQTVQRAVDESVGKKEAPPAARRRLLPVKPLNALEQQSVSVANTEEEKKATVMISEVQEKTKVNDTAPKGPYSQLTQQELISMVLKQQNQLSERDQKISELEQYIDNLLVRVMEEAPTVLMSMNSLKKAV